MRDETTVLADWASFDNNVALRLSLRAYFGPSLAPSLEVAPTRATTVVRS